MIGATLSHFRITARLGEGGMGEVWRAEDTSLGREVAIKVLPEAFVADPDRLARFEREARVLASLDHPNIAAVYEVGKATPQGPSPEPRAREGGGEPIHFLVMQLAPGETLAERVARGPIPLAEALPIAVQIAAGLEAAHDKGIVHRDLKPANVKVDREGRVKILDFGLAKGLAPEGGPEAGEATSYPTLTGQPTVAGAVLGTAPYMSPEQARGQATDRRTDVWAFGATLYEMLAARRAFEGETATDVTAKILTAEPDWAALPADCPPSVRRLLRRMMRHEARQRLQHLGDARIELQETLDGVGAGDDDAPLAPKAGKRRLGLALGAGSAIVALLAVAWILGGRGPAPSSPPLSRWTLTFDQETPLDVGGRSDPLALSPDGRTLVYSAAEANGSRLWIRPFDELAARPIPGTEGARNPFFSPDGRWLGFFSQEKLRKVALTGGSPVTVCDAPLDNLGATWGPDGTIVFASYASGLWRVDGGGGDAVSLTPSAGDTSVVQHRWPQFLPDGRRVLFVLQAPDGPRLAVFDLDAAETRVVAGVESVLKARYLPGGFLVVAQAGDLFAMRFDVDRERLLGSPVEVQRGVSMVPEHGAADFEVSAHGTLAYVPGVAAAGTVLVWVDRQGRAEPASDRRGAYAHPRLSPDGRRVAVASGSEIGVRQVEVLDLERGTRAILTSEGRNGNPFWSRDGASVLFSGDRAGDWDLYIAAAGGLEQDLRPLVVRPHEQWLGALTADRATLVYYEIHPETARDLWVVDLAAGSEPRPWLATPANELGTALSPDERHLAYVSNETGRQEVYVRTFPGGQGPWIVSTGGGAEPRWSADGTEVFYRDGFRLMAVPVETDPVFRAGTPRLLFEGPYLREVAGNANYDVDPGGDRFLMIRQDVLAADRLNVVLGWATLVRAAVGREP